MKLVVLGVVVMEDPENSKRRRDWLDINQLGDAFVHGPGASAETASIVRSSFDTSGSRITSMMYLS